MVLSVLQILEVSVKNRYGQYRSRSKLQLGEEVFTKGMDIELQHVGDEIHRVMPKKRCLT